LSGNRWCRPARASLLLLALVGGGCVSPGELFKTPRVTVVGASVSRLTPLAADLDVELEVDNPNRIDLVLNSVDYRATVNDQLVATGHRDERIVIAADGVGPAHLPVRLGLPALIKVVQQVRRDGTARYALEGNLHFEVPVLGEVEVPVRRQGDLPQAWLDRLGGLGGRSTNP
jgi:LEA14-like dessication related protein